MCNCVKLINEELAKRNLSIDVIFYLAENKVVPRLQASPIEKHRGEKPVTMSPNYCPFCGEKILTENSGEKMKIVEGGNGK